MKSNHKNKLLAFCSALIYYLKKIGITELNGIEQLAYDNFLEKKTNFLEGLERACVSTHIMSFFKTKKGIVLISFRRK